MMILISPAKKLDFSGVRPDLAHTVPALMPEVERLAKLARKLKAADLKRLMGISDALATLNHERFQSFHTPFTLDNAKHAALAFNGDTYQGLDAKTLSDADLAYAQDHLRILSGLYGLLRPLDLMQPYRLEMGIKLANPRGEDLYDFWGERVTALLNDQIKADPDPVVINLASTEYSSVVQTKKLQARLITPVFKEVKDDVAKVIGLMAKRARGAMARHIIVNRIEDPMLLKKFSAGGYKFHPEHSTDSRFEFYRQA
ncbi:peroxide stress protein YaaA [Govanella unica]|uniref:UPF0246 protein NYP16_08660 n=1 Tax=Govanella unica TaxID=2975056 RepID=A0A9X3TYL5_9PROT|nr:peroxide stress protein YaaA [Govania unica]MDA5194018.1 peroxide stress protein YaaA [Govania unica]